VWVENSYIAQHMLNYLSHTEPSSNAMLSFRYYSDANFIVLMFYFHCYIIFNILIVYFIMILIPVL